MNGPYSPLGNYILKAIDTAGGEASGNYNIIKDPRDVITATADSAAFKLSEFGIGRVVKAKNLIPFGQVKVTIQDPAVNAWELNIYDEMFADDNGEFELNFNSDPHIFVPRGVVPLEPVE